MIIVANEFPEAMDAARVRPLLELAKRGDGVLLTEALYREEQEERNRDREYWKPLREELQRMRFDRLRNPG